VEKIGFGILLFTGLCILLWIPMLLLSSGGLTTTPAPVSEVKFSINYAGTLSLFEQTQQDVTEVTGAAFESLRSDYPGVVKADSENNLESISLSTYSENDWVISGPAKQSLLADLSTATENSFLTVSFIITRKSASSSVLTQTYDVPISATQQHDLAEIITLADGSDFLEIPQMLPSFVRLPGVTGEMTFPNMEGSVKLTYRAETDTKYWILVDENNNAFSFYIVGSPMPVGLTSSFASVGLISLYTTYIIMVFNLVREMFSGSVANIIYENMNDVDDLLSLITDILLVQQLKDLVLEENLYCELIELFRSPERLIQMTKEKDLKKVKKIE
jgi:hypothetical protein